MQKATSLWVVEDDVKLFVCVLCCCFPTLFVVVCRFLRVVSTATTGCCILCWTHVSWCGGSCASALMNYEQGAGWVGDEDKRRFDKLEWTRR